jgi:hypothetical protein
VPSQTTPKPGGQESSTSVSAVERATSFGALCVSLPRSAEAAEAVDNFLLSHSVAVIYDSDLLDAIESIAAKLDFDVIGISIQRVPDQLDQARDRRRRPEALKMLLVEFDIEIHGG